MSCVVDVLFYSWCGGCLVWSMSGVVDVPFLPIVWWMSDVVDVWCGGSPVWWMSGVVDVLFYPWCGGCLCGGCWTIHPTCTITFYKYRKEMKGNIHCYIIFLILVGSVLKMQLRNFKSRTHSKYHLKPSSKRAVRKGKTMFMKL